MEVAAESLKGALKEYFGFKSFKGQQEQVIESILAGKDTFVIMPTGGGKSLCYQLPAILTEGTTIVVSPLIALMKNQVDLLRSYSSDSKIAHFLNSSLSRAQAKEVRQDVLDKKTKLLYVAPETLNKKENIEFLKEIKISFIAVDEAHCISEWGHDFRPEYRKIRTIMQLIGQRVPLIALTATATPKVQEDIVKNLGLEVSKVYLSSFNRGNLYYEVRPKPKKEKVHKEIVQFIKNNEGKSGIIYVLSRKSTEELAEVLNVNGIKAAPYHAGMEAPMRSKIQDDFLMEEIDVIVATIAFGMGIDKPDIRFVIHYNIPKSIENYYQETGRAGRDGLEGKCIAYYSPKDVYKLEKFLRDKSFSEREMGNHLLNEIIAYSESPVCRRKFLLHYFGESFDAAECNDMCDNCAHPKDKFDGKEQVLLVLQTVAEIKEKQNIQQVLNIIAGKKTQEVMQFGFDKLEVFGKGSKESESYWNSVIRQTMLNELLRKDIEEYGVLKFTDAGKEFLSNPTSIDLYVSPDFEPGDEGDAAEGRQAVLDPTLLKMLKDIRRQVAKSKDLPPYVIFQDPSLEDMATLYPTTLQELENVSGVSKGKAIKYGSQFVKLIETYVEENDISKPEDYVVKSLANKSGIKIYIIQNTDKKIPLEDIARNKGLKLEELLVEMKTIVDSGTKVDIDYYIDEEIDEESQDIIYDYFSTAESDCADEALKELEDEGITMEEIQLMRIKFLSEMAN